MPTDFLRRFEKRDNDIVILPKDRWIDGQETYRLASSLFKSNELSVDDAEISSAAETAARGKAPAGVASVPRALVDELGLRAEPAPLPDNPAHCLIFNVKKEARRLAKEAKIVLPLSGVRVVEGR